MNKFGALTTMKDIIRERAEDITDYDNLRGGKLDGRMRTSTRAAPTSGTDVLTGDAEGDVIIDGTYVYTCYSINEVLKWDRRTHATSW